jgi:murein DD-endopeptidase MepM/ murein hydrolase activator NlpD
MPRPKGFNLLIVKSDGSGVFRLTFPRWLFGVAVGGMVVAVSTLGAIYTDYLSLRLQRASFAELRGRFAQQQAAIDDSEKRAREVRAEIDSWRDLHARIWEPFGPEAAPALRRGTGIGGGGTPGRAAIERSASAVKEEMERLAGIVKEEGNNLRALDRFLGKAGKVLASLPSRWPLRGPVNSDFGKRLSPWTSASESHSGIDIGAPIGSPVKAPAPGTVVFAEHNAEYGLTLILDHGNNTKSLYGHLSKVHVTVNQRVHRGELVALSGNTGRSTGPHLHYEIQVKGQPVNPNAYIWEDGPLTARSASAR